MSADIKLLGGLLGVVIREQHGEEAFQLVEQVRAEAQDRRKGDAGAEEALRATIDQLDAPSLDVLIKAFSNYFQLINIAEDQQRIRVLRSREAKGALSESIDSAVANLRAAGIDAEQMRALLDHLRVRLVVTAHPSEAKRKEVLIKLRQIAQMIAWKDEQRLRAAARAARTGSDRHARRSRNCGRRARRAPRARKSRTRSISGCTSSRR